MRKSAIALAALAVISFTGTAVAGEVKNATGGSAALTDSEMDSIVAGAPGVQQKCNLHGCHLIGGNLVHGKGVAMRTLHANSHAGFKPVP
jgi:hypothetical protein